MTTSDVPDGPAPGNPVPAEAITDEVVHLVAEAIHRLRRTGAKYTDIEVAAVALRTAAPDITARATTAERERIIRLAIDLAEEATWTDKRQVLREFAGLLAAAPGEDAS